MMLMHGHCCSFECMHKYVALQMWNVTGDTLLYTSFVTSTELARSLQQHCFVLHDTMGVNIRDYSNSNKTTTTRISAEVGKHIDRKSTMLPLLLHHPLRPPRFAFSRCFDDPPQPTIVLHTTIHESIDRSMLSQWPRILHTRNRR